MTDLRLGVIGVGHLGRHHARIYAGMPGVRLVAVADVLAGRAREIGGLYGAESFEDFRELAGKVDAVSLAVPTSLHAEIGCWLLGEGIDVLVEKPIASSVEGAQALIDAARRHSRILQVGHVERFNPVVRMAKDLATSPQFFEIHRLSVFSARSLDVDVVLDLMIHDLDIVLSLVRSEVEDVRAVGIPVLSRKADIANARVQFRNGCVANLTASRVSTEKVRKLRFFQPHDYLSLDYAAQRGTLISLRQGRITQQALEPEVTEPLKPELEGFVQSVSRRTDPAVTGEDGLRALELGLKINAVMAEHQARQTAG